MDFGITTGQIYSYSQCRISEFPHFTCSRLSNQPTAMPRKGSYVDNATNRSLGRVGMAYGSAVVSSSSRSSGGASYGGGSSYGGASSYSDYPSTTSTQRTYADNSINRSIGRVGQPLGSHVVSKDGSVSVSRSTSGSTATSSSTKTYADNPMNRRINRVGKPVGSHVVSKDGSVSTTASRSSTKMTGETGVYQDNALNRKLDRVGKPLGTHVQHEDGSVTISASSTKDVSASGNRSRGGTGVYTDNALNRKLGRVGKPLGTHVQHKDRKPKRKPKKPVDPNIELENELVSEQTLEEIRVLFLSLAVSDPGRPAVQSAQYQLQRYEVEENWDKQGIRHEFSRAEESSKEIIPLSEVNVQEQIGSGGFGEVYAGVWKHTRIAYKKFICQQITNKKKKQIVQEITIFSKLQHPNIVRMFGVVTEVRNLGIIMEYLSKTLFYALFNEEVRFEPDQKKKLVTEVISAVQYLHEADIVHCDLKSQNVLLDSTNVAKLCDFGLSAVKNSMTSTSSALAAPGQGTPRYSAPEVLRGELLKLAGLKKADIYSLSLLIYQVLVEEEPFEDFNMPQLLANVGRGNERPDLKTFTDQSAVRDILTRAWDKLPSGRPEVQELSQRWSKVPIADFPVVVYPSM